MSLGWVGVASGALEAAETHDPVVPAEEREGGAVVEADKLLSAVEEAILQTAGQDALLCKGCQGGLGTCFRLSQLGGLRLGAPGGAQSSAWWTGALVSPLQSLIFDEVDLSDASVAETSTKNINNSFTVRQAQGCCLKPGRAMGHPTA